MTHASRIAAQLREFEGDDDLSPELREQVADRLDELDDDDDTDSGLSCPYCGDEGDCDHRVSATEMVTRWERRVEGER